MTWKPGTREPTHGVGMRPFLRCNLAIPKLWAICQETSTQSEGACENPGVSASPRLAPRRYLSLVATRGHPKPAHLQACGQGKRGGEESGFYESNLSEF